MPDDAKPPKRGDFARAALMLGLGVALAGCAAFGPSGLPVGTSLTDARRALFGQTGEYPLPGGGTRLEFARGRETYMLDFDRAGTLVASQQVLTESNLASIAPGTSRADLRLRFGRPAWIYGVRYREPQQVWNYRFEGADCVWYQVSISDATQQVTETGLGPDPACEAPNDRQ